MIKLITIIIFATLTACNTGEKKESSTTDTTDSTSNSQPGSDKTNTANQASGKIEIERFGELKIGQEAKEVISVIGQPDKKSVPIEWGADGLMHEDWTFASKGLLLNMTSEKNNSDKKSIFSIIATAPCTFKTSAGMGIGNTYDEVEKTYDRFIDRETTDQNQVTVGSIYGGIIFTFTNEKVSRVFLGAAAE